MQLVTLSHFDNWGSKIFNSLSEKQLKVCYSKLHIQTYRNLWWNICTQFATTVQCCSKPISKQYTERLVMQICVTDLFIELKEQSKKQNNAYQKQNLWRWFSLTNWIWCRDRNREMLFICYTKTNFIIHNSLYAHFVIAIHTVLLSELSFWICKSF